MIMIRVINKVKTDSKDSNDSNEAHEYDAKVSGAGS